MVLQHLATIVMKQGLKVILRENTIVVRSISVPQ